MVVGDAAGHAKPLSGGGLYMSLVAARSCGITAVEALERDDLSAGALAAYDRRWRTDIEGELTGAYRLRDVYRQLRDSDLEWALRTLRLPGMRGLVDRLGDIDFPTWLTTGALHIAPSLRRFLQARGADMATVDQPAELVLDRPSGAS